MKKNDKSVRGGIEDFLCPFEDMYITQGSNGKFSHQGTMANDVRGKEVGVRYYIYAPCDIKCLKLYPSTGQSMWQSKRKVRFANGRIDYATFMVCHDNSMDCTVGMERNQGEIFYQMGDKGFATGVHTHIQISQSSDTSWYKNEYGIYKFNNEYDTDDCYFVDNTNILNGNGGNWKFLKDVSVVEPEPPKNPIYVTLGDMYVRWGASYNDGVKLVKDLTDDGKAHATSTNPYAYAAYKKGTKFTVYEFLDKGYGLWGRSPSGWICIKGQSGRIYCEEVKD